MTHPAGSEAPRTAMVSVRLSREEEEELRAEANKQGETLSEFVRGVLRRRTDAGDGAADVNPFPTSCTVVGSGLALESDHGMIVPRTEQPYMITSYLG
jgi:hypothetical protein